MSGLLKKFGWVTVLAAGLPSAWAFSLLGPIGPTADAWQVPVIGYNLPGDIGGPKNLSEEYRWNTPTNYYAFDVNFLEYFGTTGASEVEKGIALISGVMTNLAATDLNNFPLESTRINYRAEQLHLFDLKSEALWLMTEELGLSEPDRFVWTLRDRRAIAGLSCPFMIYDVIKRNFDPFTWEPSTYINGQRYTYFIVEGCTGPNPLAVTFNVPVDPLALEFTPLHSSFGLFRYGAFAVSFSQDDVGCLKYLYRNNNYNFEQSSSDSEMFRTNSNAILLSSSNLTLFAAQALTNNAAALTALYPNLVITGTTNIFTNLFVTNVTAFVTNGLPWSPAGSLGVGFTTNIIGPIPTTLFVHTFANLVQFQFINGHWVAVPISSLSAANGFQVGQIQNTTVSIAAAPFGQVGVFTLATNTTRRFVLHTGPVGEYAILSDFFSNACDVAILGVVATNVIAQTNFILGTNTGITGITNGTTNVFAGQVVAAQSVEIDFFTNHTFVVFPVICTRTNVALRAGMNEYHFARQDFDSLLGRFFQPITNYYSLL